MKILKSFLLLALTFNINVQNLNSGADNHGPDSEKLTPKSGSRYTKHNLREENPGVFVTDEARRIGDQVLL